MWYRISYDNELDSCASTKRALIRSGMRSRKIFKGLYTIPRGNADLISKDFVIDETNEKAVSYFRLMERVTGENWYYPTLLYEPPKNKQFGLYEMLLAFSDINKRLRLICENEDFSYPPIKTFNSEKESLEAIKQHPSTVTAVGDGTYRAHIYYAAHNMIERDYAEDYIDALRDTSRSEKINGLDFAGALSDLRKAVQEKNLRAANYYIFDISDGPSRVLCTQRGELKDFGDVIKDII